MNAISPLGLSAQDGPSARVREPSRVIAAASMAELVTLGRLFQAAINDRRPSDSEQADAEMGVLAPFDDELSLRICERAPADIEEYRIKASYLLGRLRGGSMSSDVDDSALAALERDCRALGGTLVVGAVRCASSSGSGDT